MKKLLIGLLLLLSWSPYLFLATSIEDVDMSEKSWNCIAQGIEHSEEYVILSSVYYSPLVGGFSNNSRTILPYFGVKRDYTHVRCGDRVFYLGTTDFAKPGDKVNVYTKVVKASFMGMEIGREEGVEQAGNQWNGSKEGETILIKLINDKEVKFFGGKPVDGVVK